VVDADDAPDDADDVVELGDTFVAGDRDLQFPAVVMVTTDLRVGMLLDVDGVEGDDGNGVDFLVCLVVASESGVLEFPRFFSLFILCNANAINERKRVGRSRVRRRSRRSGGRCGYGCQVTATRSGYSS